MPSSISWLDFDRRARERSQRLLALFNEPGTRDELGMGSIRNSLADLMFPGTSTIQTRLKYMLLVPWMYAQMERRQVPSSQFSAHARDLEIKLIAELDRSGYVPGIIGSTARSGLQRLPSSVYWSSLGAWGIRLFDGSQETYHRTIDLLYARRGRQQSSHFLDSDEHAYHTRTWHKEIAQHCPKNFPSGQTIDLLPGEARFLRDRILERQPHTYLAWLAEQPEMDDSQFPWTHTRREFLPSDIAQLVEHARLFSGLLHGASLLYNLLLARCTENPELTDAYIDRLTHWREHTDWRELDQWDLDAFFTRVRCTSHQIRSPAELFVRHWHVRACEWRGQVADDRDSCELVRNRERALKRTRSRFDNASARAQWGGASGTDRLSFRWATVQQFMSDLHDGLNRQPC